MRDFALAVAASSGGRRALKPGTRAVMKSAQSKSAAKATRELDRLFALQRAAFARERYPDLASRQDRLARLKALVVDNEARFADAVDRDFGDRSEHETRLAEIYIVASEIADAQRNLDRWMRRERVTTPLHLMPGRAFIERQPIGVAGIISPWNYPVQLALAPALGALAAGNRVLLKPSEITPATSKLLRELVAANFAEDEFAVVTGDAEIGARFTQLPFDHLFFTGSTAVGRLVARAAAENMTPVTLELGGKSPALFAPDADIALCAPRLMSGKLLNAGQTCIAPDYALVPERGVDTFVAALQKAAAELYPSYAANADYTAIVNEHHYRRLTALIDDARGKGARIVVLNPANETPDPASRKLLPALILGVRDDMAVMREEIFGPLLPIETYATLDDAVARLGTRPHPLAFYYFGSTGARCGRVLKQTLAGGVTVNDTLWHFAHRNLPFGGVGASGSGAYHGEASFLTFTHRKPVFVQPRFAATKLLYPPYGDAFERVLALLRKLNG
ncbi:MAG: coniferyl aldehyde dehydrogenase [Burkholderiales bacterium]|nr:coniferyl aldehyde dehydrogenase [Burkholderiales bacterium]